MAGADREEGLRVGAEKCRRNKQKSRKALQTKEEGLKCGKLDKRSKQRTKSVQHIYVKRFRNETHCSDEFVVLYCFNRHLTFDG